MIRLYIPIQKRLIRLSFERDFMRDRDKFALWWETTTAPVMFSRIKRFSIDMYVYDETWWWFNYAMGIIAYTKCYCKVKQHRFNH